VILHDDAEPIMANPTEIVLAETEQGRGILGVVDGFSPKGVEDTGEIRWRKEFLRKIGYKLVKDRGKQIV
jgi:adenosine/AMP kinase